METKDLIANLREWHENLISELCAEDVLTCDDLCGYPGPCIVIQAANLLEAQQKRIAELEAALREQEERRWIPVTERLPEIGRKCLIANGEIVKIGFIRPDGVWKTGVNHNDLWGRFSLYPPTQWMPLPRPQKEDA